MHCPVSLEYAPGVLWNLESKNISFISRPSSSIYSCTQWFENSYISLQNEVLLGAKFANATLKTRQNNRKGPGLNDI
jgi:hypothetical protein